MKIPFEGNRYLALRQKIRAANQQINGRNFVAASDTPANSLCSPERSITIGFNEGELSASFPAISLQHSEFVKRLRHRDA